MTPEAATGVPGAGLARYYISASPSTGPKRFCGLTAVMLAIPDLSLPGPSGLIAGAAPGKDCVPGDRRAPTDRPRAHQSSDCGSTTGRGARPSHLTDSPGLAAGS
jgi:hypothetical protein